MLQQQVYIINLVLMGADAMLVIAAGYSAYFGTIWYGEIVPGQLTFLLSIIVVMFINNYVIGYLKLYADKAPTSFGGILIAVSKVVPPNFIFISTTISLFEPLFFPRFFVFLFVLLCCLYTVVFRICASLYITNYATRSQQARKILIVADSERGDAVSKALKSQLSWGHEIIGRLTETPERKGEDGCIGALEDLPVVLRERPIDEVVFALNGDRGTSLKEHLDVCRKIGVCVSILPAMWSPGQTSISVESCQGVPFINIRFDSFNANGLLYKRILDIIGGTVGFSLLVAMFPFIALAIKLDTPGPIIFKQQRKGQHGRIFQLYKFRTMYANAEDMKKELMSRNEMNGHMFKLENDPRITRVGKFLRKTSLDEFPQFVNVMKGEMSLVGTRPPTIQEVEQYQPEHLKRIAAKPGITGLWQVSGRNKIKDFEHVVELDCRYLVNWRFSDDLKILFKTIIVVLRRKGAS